VVREFIKLIVAAAIIVIAGGLIALFASGYISAFKPGGTTETPGEHVVGGGGNAFGGGSVAGLVTPSPGPVPTPGTGMPETVQMPPGPEPTMPPLQPVLPPVTTPLPWMQVNPYLPVQPPSMPPEGPDSRIIRDRPVPLPPSPQLPLPGEIPIIAPPGSPASPPGQPGWLQVTNWLLRLMPVLFPGMFPGWTWWS
jgi:hypothetical protein